MIRKGDWRHISLSADCRWGIFFLKVFFRDRVFLCSLRCHGICSVDPTGLEFTEIRVLGLKHTLLRPVSGRVFLFLNRQTGKTDLQG